MSSAGQHGDEQRRAAQFERRQIEVLETEDEMLRNAQRLGCVLRTWVDDAGWASQRKPRALLVTTHDTLRALRQVHKDVRALVAASLGGGARKIAQVFAPAMCARLEQWHSQYEQCATRLSSLLHARHPRAGGDEELQRVALDLLLRPTQRLMKYPLFLDELAKHACDDALCQALTEAAAAARGVAAHVNDAKRLREQHDRVYVLAESIRDVPEGVVIGNPRRRVLMEASNIMQKGREGYRRLFVLNDAVIVCKQGMKKVEFSAGVSEDVRFKDLISLRYLSPQMLPSVITPPALLASLRDEDGFSKVLYMVTLPMKRTRALTLENLSQADDGGGAIANELISERYAEGLSTKELAFSFDLRGRCFLGPQILISRLVGAILEVR
jgi:hypothetical protein